MGIEVDGELGGFIRQADEKVGERVAEIVVSLGTGKDGQEAGGE
jgi:hypothetical protein